MTKKLWTGLLLATTLTLASASSFALAAQTAGQDMKDAGHDTKDAAKSTGHGIKKGTKTGYSKTRASANEEGVSQDRPRSCQGGRQDGREAKPQVTHLRTQ